MQGVALSLMRPETGGKRQRRIEPHSRRCRASSTRLASLLLVFSLRVRFLEACPASDVLLLTGIARMRLFIV